MVELENLLMTIKEMRDGMVAKTDASKAELSILDE